MIVSYIKYNELINFDDFDANEDDPIEDSPLMDKDFVTFLYDNNVYNKFIKNCLSIKKCNRLPRMSYIYGAFDWYDTPEGSDFWKDIHKKWVDHVNYTISNMIRTINI